MSPPLYDRLRRDLRSAMKSRDRLAVSVLRTAISAIDNAGAVQDEVSVPLVGISQDVPRRDLDETAIRSILRAELSERQEAIRVLSAQDATTERLYREAELLARYVAAE